MQYIGSGLDFSLQKDTIKDIIETNEGTGVWIIVYKEYNINVKFPIFKKVHCRYIRKYYCSWSIYTLSFMR